MTPQYVQGITPARELPVVGKIALGSLVNKFVIIIPIALLLTAFAPWVLPYLLILGGSYLCFEGAEKVLEWFGVQHGHADEGARDERKLVLGAVRTDLILSTEIMLISLASLDKGLTRHLVHPGDPRGDRAGHDRRGVRRRGAPGEDRRHRPEDGEEPRAARAAHRHAYRPVDARGLPLHQRARHRRDALGRRAPRPHQPRRGRAARAGRRAPCGRARAGAPRRLRGLGGRHPHLRHRRSHLGSRDRRRRPQHREGLRQEAELPRGRGLPADIHV